MSIQIIATIHHLAFHLPAEAESHGVRKIRLQVAENCNNEDDIAEYLFMATNGPTRPDIVEESGRCYSMSTGDVAETAEGKLFLCCGTGWRELLRCEFELLVAMQKAAAIRSPDRRWTVDFDGIRLLDSIAHF